MLTYRLRFSVIHLTCESTLDELRDKHGTIRSNDGIVAAKKARDLRNADVLGEFETHVLPYADALLSAAHSALDAMPPAWYHAAWSLLLDDLAHATSEIHRILSANTGPIGIEQAAVRNVELWPYLVTWAERSSVASDLAEQHRPRLPELSGDEQRDWTERAQAAWNRNELQASERWHDAAGRLITLGYLIEHDDSTVVVITGELGGGQMQVLGHYATAFEAGQAAPPQVPPGVLRADAHPYRPRVVEAETVVGELIRQVGEAQRSQEVAEALEAAAEDQGRERGPLARTAELLDIAAEFCDALETRQGQRSAARLGVLAQQVRLLTAEVLAVAEEVSAGVGVLPPHRIARPQYATASGRQSLAATPPALSSAHPGARSGLHR